MLRVFFGSEVALNIRCDSNGYAVAKASGSNTAIGRAAFRWLPKRLPQWLRSDLAAAADPLQCEWAEDVALAMIRACLEVLERPYDQMTS
jgi:hypothetical protein